jgi:hypothetical protein
MRINSFNAIQNIPKVGFSSETVETPPSTAAEEKNDTVEIKKVKPPQIGGLRLFFSMLTDEQINKVNEAKRLPKNAKFIANGYGGYTVSNNWFNVTPGTRSLPAGFEVRKNWLGFAIVLPKDSESVFLKNKNED